MDARLFLLGCLSLAAASTPVQAQMPVDGTASTCIKAAKADFARSHPRATVEVLGTRAVHDAKLGKGQKGYYVTVEVRSSGIKRVYDAYCAKAASAARGGDPRIQFVRQR